MDHVREHFDPFLESHDQISSKSGLKLLEILRDGKKKAFLQIELAAVIDVGEIFVKATYNLEGDGPESYRPMIIFKF